MSKEYWQGYDAYYDGEIVNPYALHTDAAAEWWSGWYDADLEARGLL